MGRAGLRRIALCATIIALAAALEAPGRAQSAEAPRHDKAFWRAIAANKFTPPAGEPLEPLVRELSGYLGSPDPELRDDIAYTTLAAWIYRQRIVPAELRRSLTAEWQRNLRVGIGSAGTPDVLRRSFSALALGLVAALDNDAPELERAAFESLLQSALTYLRQENDVRGFEPGVGWVHSVAHTADLLKFLARSRHLTAAEQHEILAAIADKLSRVDTVLTHGEDERLARVALSIAAREDVDSSVFRRWLPAMAPVRPTGPPTPVDLARNQNRKSLLVSLYAVLSTDRRGLASVELARTLVLETLRTFM